MLNMSVLLGLWLLSVAAAAALAAAVPPQHGGYNCSNKFTCKSCLTQAECQWCSAETMWRDSSATAARCRSRPEAEAVNIAAPWCPATDILDPRELGPSRVERCNCGQSAEVNSKHCSGRGTRLDCGGCDCPLGEWKGPICEEMVCGERGDLLPGGCRSDKDCNGGVCQCGNCICPEPDSFYWDVNFCTEMCPGSGTCALCYQRYQLRDNGHISDSGRSGIASVCHDECPYVDLVAGERTLNGRNCTVEDDERCELYYVATSSGPRGNMLKLVARNCSNTGGLTRHSGTGGVVGASLVALLLLGLLVMGGVALWKAYIPSTTETPLFGLEHEQEAEVAQGVNPLYKPPISKFKNPLYEAAK